MSNSLGIKNEDMIEELAGLLHDNWRINRGMSPGSDERTFLPRERMVEGKVFDIANLNFENLPEYFQKENREAARVAMGGIFETDRTNSVVSTDWLEKEAAETHKCWMLRNVKTSPEHLMCNYDELDVIEQQKDRDIVLEALGVYVNVNPESGIFRIKLDEGEDFIPDDNKLHGIVLDAGRLARQNRMKISSLGYNA